LPTDQDRQRELRRHVVRVRDGLALVELMVAGEPFDVIDDARARRLGEVDA
jgi:hypothetical protein